VWVAFVWSLLVLLALAGFTPVALPYATTTSAWAVVYLMLVVPPALGVIIVSSLIPNLLLWRRRASELSRYGLYLSLLSRDRPGPGSRAGAHARLRVLGLAQR
jgi:hypothetical protein